jgi:uncharacterized membrane protein YadS
MGEIRGAVSAICGAGAIRMIKRLQRAQTRPVPASIHVIDMFAAGV